jgi:ankyrin repeat protein
LLGVVEGPGRQKYLNDRLMTAAGVQMNADSVRLLVKLGADPNYESNGLGTPLSYCCWQGDGNGGREDMVVEETLNVLIAAGAKVDGVHGQAIPLHEAVSGDWGSPTSVRVLLDHGANPNILNVANQSALMIAAMQGEVGCVRELLARGADRSLRDRKRKSALDYAQDHVKVWRGIVKKPPSMVSKFMSKVGLDLGSLKDSHKQALRDAEESVRLLSE